MNGSDAMTTAHSSSGKPRRSAPPSPSTKVKTTNPAMTVISVRATSAAVPWAGSRTVHHASGQSAASPTAGDSRVHRRRPHAMKIAWPIRVADPRIARKLA